MWLRLGKVIIAVVICLSILGVDLKPLFGAEGRDSFGVKRKSGDSGCSGHEYQKTGDCGGGSCMQQTRK